MPKKTIKPITDWSEKEDKFATEIVKSIVFENYSRLPKEKQEDLISEGKVIYYTYVKPTYDPSLGMSLKNYAYLTIPNRLKSFLKTDIRQTRVFGDSALLETKKDMAFDSDESKASDSKGKSYDISDEYENQEVRDKLDEIFNKNLTSRDRKIIKMKIGKFSHKEIGDEMKIPTEKIDDILQDIYDIIRKNYNKVD